LWTPALLKLNGISPANTAFVVAFNGLGGFIGQSTSGRLIQRFGIVPVLIPAFLLGAAATVGLGYGASSIALAATFIGLIGVFMGLGTGGAIALAATIYPTPIRSTGAGWGMAMGRFGQIIGPLIAGVLLGAGWTAGPIMTVTACGGLIGAVFVVLFSVWLSRRGGRPLRRRGPGGDARSRLTRCREWRERGTSLRARPATGRSPKRKRHGRRLWGGAASSGIRISGLMQLKLRSFDACVTVISGARRKAVRHARWVWFCRVVGR